MMLSILRKIIVARDQPFDVEQLRQVYRRFFADHLAKIRVPFAAFLQRYGAHPKQVAALFGTVEANFRAAREANAATDGQRDFRFHSSLEERFVDANEEYDKGKVAAAEALKSGIKRRQDEGSAIGSVLARLEEAYKDARRRSNLEEETRAAHCESILIICTNGVRDKDLKKDQKGLSDIASLVDDRILEIQDDLDQIPPANDSSPLHWALSKQLILRDLLKEWMGKDQGKEDKLRLELIASLHESGYTKEEIANVLAESGYYEAKDAEPPKDGGPSKIEHRVNSAIGELRNKHGRLPQLPADQRRER